MELMIRVRVRVRVGVKVGTAFVHYGSGLPRYNANTGVLAILAM